MPFFERNKVPPPMQEMAGLTKHSMKIDVISYDRNNCGEEDNKGKQDGLKPPMISQIEISILSKLGKGYSARFHPKDLPCRRRFYFALPLSFCQLVCVRLLIN